MALNTMYLDYDRSGRGWEVFDAISGRTIVHVPFCWTARFVCWLSDRAINAFTDRVI